MMIHLYDPYVRRVDEVTEEAIPVWMSSILGTIILRGISSGRPMRDFLPEGAAFEAVYRPLAGGGLRCTVFGGGGPTGPVVPVAEVTVVLSAGRDHEGAWEVIREVRYRGTRPLKMPKPPYGFLVRMPGFEAMGDRRGWLREFAGCLTVAWVRLHLPG